MASLAKYTYDPRQADLVEPSDIAHFYGCSLTHARRMKREREIKYEILQIGVFFMKSGVSMDELAAFGEFIEGFRKCRKR